MPKTPFLLATLAIVLVFTGPAVAEPRDRDVGRPQDWRERHGQRGPAAPAGPPERGYPPSGSGYPASGGAYPNGSYGNQPYGVWNGDWYSGGSQRQPPPPSPRGLHDGLWYY